MKKLLLFILPIIALFASCDKSIVYKDYRKYSTLEWNKSETETFEVQIAKDGSYQILFPFRYATGYAYTQIQIKVDHIFNGTSEQTELAFDIVGKDGKYTGEGAGDIWDSEFSIKENAELKAGKHTFTISHIMPKDKVHMVMETGLIIKDKSQQ